jgi:uncharacterized membrane protein
MLMMTFVKINTMAFFSGLLSITLLLLSGGYVSNNYLLQNWHNDARLAAAIMFIMIGIMHLIKPRKLTYMIEGWLPSAFALIILTGILEIIGGAGLLIPATAAYAKWGLIILLICMFPANIRVAVKHLPAPGGLPSKPWYTWSRLAFQPLYIIWLLL